MSRPLGLSPESSALPRAGADYAEDYFAWTQDQVAALKAGRHDRLDLENLAEEVGDLGRSVKREIASRLNVLLVHLLKWRFQPAFRSSSWTGTITEQRGQILDDLDESPSLRPYPAARLGREYAVARLKAAGETGMPEAAFPPDCPFALADILDRNFFPEAEA